MSVVADSLRNRFQNSWKAAPEMVDLHSMFETAASFIDAPRVQQAAIARDRTLRRFLIVYCCGLVIYCLAAIAVRSTLSEMHMPAFTADLLGVFVGAGLTVVISFLGHCFFTYRSVTP
jgi:hypothetical protein